MRVLVTGGAGYIGSTIVTALLHAGHHPVILDSLVTGPKPFTAECSSYVGDIGDAQLVATLCQKESIKAVIHCAARIVVPESVTKPHTYYHENCVKSLQLFTTLKEAGVGVIIFSSSASIYAHTSALEVTEESALAPASPYARTKVATEYILADICRAWNIAGISLRYFNPIGAEPTLRTGPHQQNPTHVLGQLSQAVLGKIPHFTITGTKWPTRDGTGIRDYIHVWDLARAHVLALDYTDKVMQSKYAQHNYCAINLGTGTGTTVHELHQACQRVCKREIPTTTAPPRPGDNAGSYANYTRAHELLHWKPEKTIEDGIADLFAWLKVRSSLLGY